MPDHPPIQLVVTDLDGTFWTDDHRLHPRTMEAIAELDRRGVALIAATGRRRRSAALGFAEAGLTLPSVLLNGSHGHDYLTGEDFHATGFATEAAVTVVDILERHGLGPAAYTTGADPDAWAGTELSTGDIHQRFLADHLGRRDLRLVAAEREILGFSILGRPYEVLAAAAAELAAAEVCSIAFSADWMYGEWSLMAQPLGVSKWTGVVAWCEASGLDPGAVLAIGDGNNDVELLASATIAVTIEGGDADAAAHAHHTVAPPSLGGWADILGLI